MESLPGSKIHPSLRRLLEEAGQVANSRSVFRARQNHNSYTWFYLKIIPSMSCTVTHTCLLHPRCKMRSAARYPSLQISWCCISAFANIELFPQMWMRLCFHGGCLCRVMVLVRIYNLLLGRVGLWPEASRALTVAVRPQALHAPARRPHGGTSHCRSHLRAPTPL